MAQPIDKSLEEACRKVMAPHIQAAKEWDEETEARLAAKNAEQATKGLQAVRKHRLQRPELLSQSWQPTSDVLPDAGSSDADTSCAELALAEDGLEKALEEHMSGRHRCREQRSGD